MEEVDWISGGIGCSWRLMSKTPYVLRFAGVDAQNSEAPSIPLTDFPVTDCPLVYISPFAGVDSRYLHPPDMLEEVDFPSCAQKSGSNQNAALTLP